MQAQTGPRRVHDAGAAQSAGWVVSATRRREIVAIPRRNGLILMKTRLTHSSPKMDRDRSPGLRLRRPLCVELLEERGN